MKSAFLAFTLLGISTLSTVAQDAHAGHGTPMAAADSDLSPELPPICQTADAMGQEPMAMDHEMDEAHTDLMAGMDQNNQLMMQAGMVENLDVAFVCAMIPHHQSAINMAKAELKHGKTEWAKAMAQKIIAAQEAEIAEMTQWLGEQAQ